jgi:hypothetical protein
LIQFFNLGNLNVHKSLEPLFFGGYSLKIKMVAPLDRMLGSCREVSLQQPARLADLLRFLMEENPELKPYAGFNPGDVQPYGLLVWRGGTLLTLTDMVNPADELEMIPMVAGG